MLSSIPSKILKLQLKIAVEAMTHLIGDNRSMNVIWLVVYLPPLKNMSSSVGVISYYSQYMRKKNSHVMMIFHNLSMIYD